MARTHPQINLRIPADLKDWIERRAEHNLRSLTGEIAYLLREKRNEETETAGEPAKTAPTV